MSAADREAALQDDIFPVTLGVCLDAEAIWLAIDPASVDRPAHLSHGSFEVEEGLAPFLALLDRHQVRATFFVPGSTAERYPDAVRKIRDAGHELGAHNYTHRTPLKLSPAEEREELVRGLDALERITGLRPITWRSPSWEWTPATHDILLSEGIAISTNFHDRLGPYRHHDDGAPLPLVELPVQWHLSDAIYFMHGGRMERVVRTAAEVHDLWMEEFEGLYDWPDAFFHLTLHVGLMAQPGRLRMLDRLLSTLKGRQRVRFMPACEIARRVR